jgi:membrane-associated phospholipid phosphatase
MNGQILYEFRAAEVPGLFPPGFPGAMYEWGIEVVKVIQRIENPALTALVKFITALGTEALYVPLIFIIFWLIDEKQGLRLGILIVVCAWINNFMKDILQQPRPFYFDPSLGLASESTYSTPSGHAQMSLVFWIPMAVWLGNIWARRRSLIWTAAIAFILLIGLTRLYLGVHFPTDIFAGWILGGIILGGWFFVGPRLEKLFASPGTRFHETRFRNVIAAVIALLMNSVYPQGTIFSALFLGTCLGYNLMRQRFPFSARADINGEKPGLNTMALRCLSGFAGIALIYLILRLILPGEGSIFSDVALWGPSSPLYELGRFIRYGLVGFWVSAGAPKLFQRLGLATSNG